MKNNIYSTNKIDHHPEIVAALRNGEQPYPVQIHLMPQNACNQKCCICSYRTEGNKNTHRFDCKSHIPKDVMSMIMDDFKKMKGRATELTGGGEPLLYPHKEFMFEKILQHGFDYSLVSNGTLLTDELAREIAPKMTWGRISIDCGEDETYAKTRTAKLGDIDKALEAVRMLRKYAKHPEFKLGVGFVTNNKNFNEVYTGCKKAKEAGADNVRISVAFHPKGMAYFTNEMLTYGSMSAKNAEQLNDDSFHVYNLFDERVKNVELGKQDYKFCGTKEVLCVIGGNSEVYTCCSLAFNKAGLIGDLKEIGFKELWDSPGKHKFFEKLDASKVCKYMCLYEGRNRHMISLMTTPTHVNFL